MMRRKMMSMMKMRMMMPMKMGMMKRMNMMMPMMGDSSSGSPNPSPSPPPLSNVIGPMGITSVEAFGTSEVESEEFCEPISVTTCCEGVSLPCTLYVTISGCMTIPSFPIIYNSGTGRWEGSGSGGGVTIDADLGCDSGSPGWTNLQWGFTCPGGGGELYPCRFTDPTECPRVGAVTCYPFSITWDHAYANYGGGGMPNAACCDQNDDIVVIITE